MTNITTTRRFQNSPLITPERLLADPQATLGLTPLWVQQFDFTEPPEANPAVQPLAVIWAGYEDRLLYEFHTTLAVAILWEITRLPGISIAANSNGNKSNYFRFTVVDAGDDLTTVSRFLMNAGPQDQVLKTPRRKWDMRAETLRMARAGKVSKESREVVMHHVERIAKSWEERGDMPSHLTAEAYLENLKRLIQLLDLETEGHHLSDMLPAMPHQETPDGIA